MIEAEAFASANAGLTWLLAQQHENGSWGDSPEGDLGDTAVATLALLAHGHSLTQGGAKEAALEATKWMFKVIKGAGNLPPDQSPDGLTDYALACLALSEIAIADQSTLIRRRARLCIGVLEYAVTDASASTDAAPWALLAFHVAREGSIMAPEDAALAASILLERIGTADADEVLMAAGAAGSALFEGEVGRALTLPSEDLLGGTPFHHARGSAPPAEALLFATVAAHSRSRAAEATRAIPIWARGARSALMASQGQDGSFGSPTSIGDVRGTAVSLLALRAPLLYAPPSPLAPVGDCAAAPGDRSTRRASNR